MTSTLSTKAKLTVFTLAMTLATVAFAFNATYALAAPGYPGC